MSRLLDGHNVMNRIINTLHDNHTLEEITIIIQSKNRILI
ncbi:hypothetical protein NARC_90010 [Candidatus Nitrosocosmicus arcticus]|uniref:Uncharacterized protein n=1 Tax=Candidatus Nitrosocosmicus arcticus TaxID=2035267 RepID=A0A557SU34_9ARCH|nr:hypothetical protein NARC_90010 [Candidatus Nitrosocosmicus arcticus]